MFLFLSVFNARHWLVRQPRQKQLRFNYRAIVTTEIIKNKKVIVIARGWGDLCAR